MSKPLYLKLLNVMITGPLSNRPFVKLMLLKSCITANFFRVKCAKFLLYYSVFEDSLAISEHTRFSKTVWRFPNIVEHFRKCFDDFQTLPKITEDFRRLYNIFQESRMSPSTYYRIIFLICRKEFNLHALRLRNYRWSGVALYGREPKA